MAGVEVRLNRLIDLEVTACGHQVNIDKCDKQRLRLERWLALEVEKLAVKAGEQ